MQIQETTNTMLRYFADGDRLTVADLAAISADLRSRKVPKDASIIQGGTSSLTVKF